MSLSPSTDDSINQAKNLICDDVMIPHPNTSPSSASPSTCTKKMNCSGKMETATSQNPRRDLLYYMFGNQYVTKSQEIIKASSYADITISTAMNRLELGTIENGQNRFFTDSRRSVTLRYQLWGTGPQKIFLVMGLANTAICWRYQAEYFSQFPEYQVCIFDNRGTGHSSLSPSRYTTTMMAEDAVSLMDHLGWDKFRSVHVVGISLGGMISQELCLLVPDRILSLCLVSTMAGLTLLERVPRPRGLFKAFVVELGYYGGRASYTKSLLRLLYPTHTLQSDGERLKDFHQRVLNEDFMPGIFGTTFQLMAGLTHHMGHKKLQKLKYQTFCKVVITGDKDDVVRVENSTVLAEALGADLITFKGAGHALPVERPEQFNETLIQHFTRSVQHMSHHYASGIF